MSKVKQPSYRDAVMRIQKYLLNVSFVDQDIPRVNPDGIYGKSTREAVYIFQRKYVGMPSGKVDFETWQRLLEASLNADELLSKPLGVEAFDLTLKDGVLKRGDLSDTVAIAKIILRELGKIIPEGEGISDGSLFDESTENALKALQKAFGIDESGELDKLTWNRMVRAYKSAHNFE